MGLTGSSSRDDAERQLQAAIDLGELTAQHAPADHPIFAALARAGTALALLQDEDAAIPQSIDAGTDLYNTIDDVIDRIYDAAADVRNVPDVALPATLFALPASASSVPWLPIGLVGGALALGWYLFKGRGRRVRA